MTREAREIFIRGWVHLSLWDDHEETVSIVTACGDEYIVKPSPRADELQDYLDLEVEARGRTWDDRGRMILSLFRFREPRDDVGDSSDSEIE